MDLTVRKNIFKERFEDFLELQLSNKKIGAYTVQGETLTKEMYVEKVRDTLKSVEKGNYTTVEDLEKESESW